MPDLQDKVDFNNLYVSKTADFITDYRDSKVDQVLSLEHYHDSYELDFFIKADIQIFVKDRRYEISNGDVLFISEYDVHKVLYNIGTHYTRYVINFKKEFLIDLLRFFKIDNLLEKIQKNDYKKVRVSINRRNEFESQFKTLLALYDSSRENCNAETAVLIKSYLVILLTRFNETLKNAKPICEQQKKDHFVSRIIDFIDSNYAGVINLDLLEKEFHLNKYYISHVFKEITGFTVMEYIQNRRIIEAQILLKSTSKDITEICYDCGFNNVQHFYRVFSKITNITPYNYRKRG
ncbi:MAG TPA: AraC family transcriptional regulator [Clostridiales bacterium]|nr:AraC family transcriptional regulator [Clostridiales bacterium]